jgi:mannosyl-3-phosphoglycerate phosphatase
VPSHPPDYLFVSDLDGTLLDHETYAWSPALPALAELKRRRLPLVLSSSKTRAEVVPLQQQLGLGTPLITENGAVLVLPGGVSAPPADAGRDAGPRLHVFGRDRADFLPRLHALRREHALPFAGFADWSDEEIAERTGLPVAAARRAGQRHGSEPVVWNGTDAELGRFRALLGEAGLDLVEGGRFHHVSAGADKARAVAWLREQYAQAWPAAVTRLVVLGDSPNDATMLDIADIAVVLPSLPAKEFAVRAPQVVRPERPGPAGWNEAVLGILGGVRNEE